MAPKKDFIALHTEDLPWQEDTLLDLKYCLKTLG